MPQGRNPRGYAPELTQFPSAEDPGGIPAYSSTFSCNIVALSFTKHKDDLSLFAAICRYNWFESNIGSLFLSSLLSNETLKVTCISNPKNTKAEAGAV